LIITLVSFSLPLSASEDGELLDRTEIVFEGAEREAFLEKRPKAAEYMDTVTVSEITYFSDGLKVKGFLIIPEGAGPFPCLIVNRGGNREFGEIPPEAAVSWLGRYATWGFVVVASQYRGVAGGEGIEEFGGAEINDVLNLVPLLESEPKADASRIGMWGGSRGGLMTYIALRKSKRFKAAVIVGGMSDSFLGLEERPMMEQYVYSQIVPGWEENRGQALTDRSPIRWVDELCKETPILLMHGSSDWRVSPEMALDMADALYASKHPFRFVFFEGGDHGLSEHRKEEERITRDFFDHYVRDTQPWSSCPTLATPQSNSARRV
jgi:dipeptidyl aminopeptidase/acylaminoacyl peptidase